MAFNLNTCRGALFWGRHFLGGGTLGVLGSFVRNVVLQIRFKCLDFAQKCCWNVGNGISETQISKGGMSRTPLVGRVPVPRLGAAYSSFAPGGKSACCASGDIGNKNYNYKILTF